MKKFIGGILTFLLIAIGLVGFSAAAQATPDDTETCVPSDATSKVETSEWLEAPPPGEGWKVIDTRTVTDVEAVYKTEYLVGLYRQTGWVLESPEGEGWVEIADRTIPAEGYTEHEYSRQAMTDPGSPAIPAVEEVSHQEYVFERTWEEMTDPGSPAVEEVAHTDKQFKKWVVTQEAQDAVYENKVTEREYVKVKHPGYTEYKWKRWIIIGFEYKWSKDKPSGAGWVKTDENRSVHPVLEYKWFPASRNVGDQGWTPTGNVKTERVKVKDEVPEQGEWQYAWFHAGEYPGEPWKYTGEKKKHVTQEAQPAVPPTYETRTERTGWVLESPGNEWHQVDERKVVDVEAEPGVPAVDPTYETDTDWARDGETPVGDDWTATGETRFVVTKHSYTEYKFAKHIPATWMDEVPEGDGWKVKEERETLVTEAETHQEFVYQREVEVPAVVCPEEPTEPPTTDVPTEEPPVTEPPTPVEPEPTTEEPTVNIIQQRTTVVQETTTVVETEDRLPETGANDRLAGLVVLAALAVLSGVVILAARRIKAGK